MKRLGAFALSLLFAVVVSACNCGGKVCTSHGDCGVGATCTSAGDCEPLVPPDAGSPPNDSGASDSGTEDGGVTTDAGSDAGVVDGGFDGGPGDAGFDAGSTTPDAGPEECLGTQWCWSHPKPQGQILNAVWGASSNDAWAVGFGGAMLRFDGTSWNIWNSGVRVILNGVWGANANDVWAVGWDGTILRFNGSTWSQLASGTTQHLQGVWGTASNNVWIVGQGGTALRWNGTTLAPVTTNSGSWLQAVWGSGRTTSGRWGAAARSFAGTARAGSRRRAGRRST